MLIICVKSELKCNTSRKILENYLAQTKLWSIILPIQIENFVADISVITADNLDFFL
jgi:hypothetical protein